MILLEPIDGNVESLADIILDAQLWAAELNVLI